MTILVDFSMVKYRHVFGPTHSAAVKEDPKALAEFVLAELMKLNQTFECDRTSPLVVVFDCPRKNSWRYSFYEENSTDFPEYLKPDKIQSDRQHYKGNRPKNEEIPWDEIQKVENHIYHFLKLFTDIIAVRHPKAEADDLIYAGINYFDDNIVVYSSDQDFKVFLNERVKMFEPRKGVWIKKDWDNEILLQTQIISGQKRKDNIFPCRRGFGEAKASKHAGNVQALLESEDVLFNQHYEFNKTLIDARCIPSDIMEDLGMMFETMDQFNFQPQKITKFLIKYKLRSLMQNMVRLKYPEVEEGNGFESD